MAPVFLSLHTNTRSWNLLGNGGSFEAAAEPEAELGEEYERIRRESASPKELDDPKEILGVPDLLLAALLLLLLLPDL